MITFRSSLFRSTTLLCLTTNSLYLETASLRVSLSAAFCCSFCSSCCAFSPTISTLMSKISFCLVFICSLRTFIVLSLELCPKRPLTPSESVFAVSMAASLRALATLKRSSSSFICFSFLTLSSSSFFNLASSAKLLYCCAVKCCLSLDTPLSICRTSAVIVCISTISWRFSLRLFPVSWLVQSKTKWACRLGFHSPFG